MDKRRIACVTFVLLVLFGLVSLISPVKADVSFVMGGPAHVPLIGAIWGEWHGEVYPYVGGYMNIMASNPTYFTVQKVRITVNFPSTPNPSVIGPNNWLAAGMFLQGMDSVANYQDYGFYTVLVLDNAGGLYLDVGVWTDSENPLHLWAVTDFLRTWQITGVDRSSPITLTMYWDPVPSNKVIYWYATIAGQDYYPQFNSFDMGAVRPNVIKGFYVGESTVAEWWFHPWFWWAYYFQFGIMSPQYITQSGWQARLAHPQYFNNNVWNEVEQAWSVEGRNSPFDAAWNWGGADYSGVFASIDSSLPVVTFFYNGSTLGNDRVLWVYQPPGGCPFVFPWNGASFVKDNNILPASENGNGTDTEDYYKLEQPLVPLFQYQKSSVYSLQIREFENEHDYIDQVKLLAVDHSQGTGVAVTPQGEVVTYQNPVSPASCVDNHGDSRLNEIGRMDGDVSDPTTYFQGWAGDWLVLNFGRVTAENAKLVLRDDQKCADVCIDVQVLDAAGNWLTVDVLHPRDFWSTEAVNLAAYVPTTGDFKVRLLWTAAHRLDYVGLDTSPPSQTRVSSASPILAIHSALGDVRAKLLFDDERYAELVSGQQITLSFQLPKNSQGMARDFILQTDGYYYTIRT